jgi:uncharacterized protein
MVWTIRLRLFMLPGMHSIEADSQSDQQLPKAARVGGMLCHLAAFSTVVIPLGHLLGPLLVWFIKKNEHPFIDEHGREALNFQLTVTAVLLVVILLNLLDVPTWLVLGAYSGMAMAVPILVIVAASRARRGLSRGYLLRIPFIGSARLDATKGSAWIARFGAALSPAVVSLLLVSIWAVGEFKRQSSPGWEGLGLVVYFLVVVLPTLLILLIHAFITARIARSISGSILSGVAAGAVTVCGIVWISKS